MVLAVAHEERGVSVLDCIREITPPFSPEAATKEFAETLKRYRISEATGDRYGAEWVAESFEKLGIRYVPSEQNRSELYLEFLPNIMSGQCELLDNRRLVNQLANLERKTGRGRDIVDHELNQHDDIGNAVAGVVVRALRGLGGVFGLIEYEKAVEAGVILFLDAPQPRSPRDEVMEKEKMFARERRLCGIKPPEEKPVACPTCGDPLVAKVPGGQWRCAQCGHQWWPDGPPAVTVAGFDAAGRPCVKLRRPWNA
ncbi:MAG TPA: hypothetical protein VHF01_19340 [Candidatus Acidoferrum sp.]|nr:hypothetical protein [Candidatus Acidoferrum sp.]